MEAHYVVKRPLLTEKSTFAMNEHGRYAFEVDKHATKADIKAAVELLYKVHVVKINTQLHQSRDRRLKYGFVEGKSTKKAIVRLRDGEQIELF